MDSERQRIIANLEFAHDTCFWFMRGYYRKRLFKAMDKYREASTRHTNLDLCYQHRQEGNHSHFSAHNCHYCQVQEKLMQAQRTINHHNSL